MNETDKPNYQSPEFQAKTPIWAKVDAVRDGTEAMRAAGKTYLPQFPTEADDVYDQRLDTAVLTPFYGETLNGITGTILKKSFKLGEKIPEALKLDLENIDNAKTHVEVFGQRLLTTGDHYGVAYVRVDMPKAPNQAEPMDASQSAKLNFRPFTVLYGASELADEPIYVNINGSPTLQQIRFKERGVALEGFGESCTERIRLWRLPIVKLDDGTYTRAGNGVWELWEDQGEGSGDSHKDDWQMIDNGVFPDVFTELPVAIFNANPNLENPQKCDGPVLIDHANLNIKHWQLESDHESALHTCSPTAYTVNIARNNDNEVIGEASKIPYGNGVRWDLGEGGSAGFAEPQGNGLEQRANWIEKIEKRLLDMGAGLAMENSEKAGAQTKIEAALRGGARTSRLTQIARAWQDCMEQTIVFMGMWKGLWTGKTEQAEITLGVTEQDLVMVDLAPLSAMQEKGQLSLRTFWKIMQRAAVLPDDFNADDELKEIAKEAKEKMVAMPAALTSNFTQSKPQPAMNGGQNV